MDNIDEIVADNLRQWRKSRGFTQEQLAEKAGVAAQTVTLIEGCKRWPEKDTVQRLTKALDIPQAMLFNAAFANLQRPPITPEEALEALKQFVHKESVSSLSRPKQDLFALISPLDDTQIAGQVDRLRAELLAPEHASLEKSEQNKKAR